MRTMANFFRLRRIAPVLGLFVLAPICAEYLTGYDDSVGRPIALLAGLLFLAPLYGGPALIIREVARRTSRGWPTILVLAAAFGVLQAGLVDQSLFNTSYRDIDYWADMMGPTFVPALGFSPYLAVTFVVGHMIWSIGAPIAVVESLTTRRSAPWLGRGGLAVISVLYVLVSLVIFTDHVTTQDFLAPVPQLVVTSIVVVALVGVAFLPGSRWWPGRADRQSASADRPESPPEKDAPNPWWLAVAALVLLSAYAMPPPTWWGVAVAVVLLAVTAVLVVLMSRRNGWGQLHRLALAAGALLSTAWTAFTVEPLGDPSALRKYGHNVGLTLGLLVLLAIAARRASRITPTGTDEADAPTAHIV